MAGNSKSWTPARRKKQAEIMRQRKAWNKSTGPKTDEGKAISAANAHKHGMRSAAIQALTRALADQRRAVAAFVKDMNQDNITK